VRLSPNRRLGDQERFEQEFRRAGKVKQDRLNRSSGGQEVHAGENHS
jgi:hypothetical protein